MKISDLVIESSKIAKSIPYIHYQKYDYFEKDISKDEEKIYNLKAGRYISIIPKKISNSQLEKILFSSLIKLLPKKITTILIVGLGNDYYISDAFGSFVINKINPSNKIKTFIPKIHAITGIESIDVVQALVHELSPSCIIAIDSIVTSSIDKLGKCYQLTTAGISPGGGLYKHKKDLSSNLLNTPIVAIGFPTILSFKDNFFSLYNCEDILERSSNIISNIINKINYYFQ